MAEQIGGRSAALGARPNIPRRLVVRLPFERPGAGPAFTGGVDGLDPTRKPGFFSNGGVSEKHPDRRRPFGFEATVPEVEGRFKRLSLTGVFALHAGKEVENDGAVGAQLKAMNGSESPFRFNFVSGKTYSDAVSNAPVNRVIGDGSSIQTIGWVDVDGEKARVELLTIDLPANVKFDRLVFNDLGTPASFIIFDVFLEAQAEPGCPFGEHSGGVPLAELGSIVKLGDRVRFTRAVHQLEASIDRASDLDEARGQSLTFLSVIAAATLDMGGSRNMITVGLDAARALDKCKSREDIKAVSHDLIKQSALPFVQSSKGASDKLVDRALGIVERSFAKTVTDAAVAAELGLSTSHFRFLFKQATGQPFHKYVVALRLERAYAMLIEGDLQVTAVAASVGFAGLSHFSRAFTGRFGVSPAQVRRQKGPADD